MILSFLDQVDLTIRLILVHEASAEGKRPDDYVPNPPRVSMVDLYSETRIGEFLSVVRPVVEKRIGKSSTDPDERLAKKSYDYRWDAVTFGKKAFAWIYAARTVPERYLFWVDADVVFRQGVPAGFLSGLFRRPQPSGDAVDLVYFGRKVPHSETGFYGIDLESPRALRFVDRYARFWEGVEILRVRNGWTDCHAFDLALSESARSDGLSSRSLSTVPEGHVIARSPLGSYLDHQKGPRKKMGKSWELA